MKVYLYIENMGDGSNRIVFVKEDDKEKMDKVVEEDDSFWDGDGDGPKKVLTFPSEQAAIEAGIYFYTF